MERIPHPVGDEKAPLQALIFDSVFNSFRGIIAYFKITNGSIRQGDKVKFFNTGQEYVADEVGVLKMDMIPRKELQTGEGRLYHLWYQECQGGEGGRYHYPRGYTL